MSCLYAYRSLRCMPSHCPSQISEFQTDTPNPLSNEKRKETMSKPVPKTDLFVRLFSILIVSAVVTAQTAAPTPLVAEKIGVQSLNPRGTDPNPEDATRAILTAFNKYEVIGMTAAHDNKDIDDFILHLIRESGFPGKVQDIVVECRQLVISADA
jgi:hypothetical protein